MARFPNLSPDATPIRMERTTIFALISLVVLEVTIVFPTVWLLGEDSTSWQPILRILLRPLRLLQSWYLVRQFCGTEPSDESAKRCCCWKLLPYCLVVMESGFLLVQIDYMEGSAIRILLMIAHTILWTVDVAGMIYLISPLPGTCRDPVGEDASELCKCAEPVVLGREEAGGSCAICLEDFAEGDEAQRLPCGHIFHNPCIKEWLLRSRHCPLRCPEPLTFPKVPAEAVRGFSPVLPGQVEDPVEP